ncbi:MAG TPA: hypothetical protein VKQ36_02530, partial [Ktedonobacterales bacterium]|nr:hypothetical protein [Ktedonobacterales bacterium]
MNIDEQLSEILSSLGVELETSETAQTEEQRITRRSQEKSQNQRLYHVREDEQFAEGARPFSQVGDDQISLSEPAQAAEISLFQTSREHYGVFY